VRLVTIASGSSGNCSLVDIGNARFLIDAGISARRIISALESLNIQPESIDGILITHEHNDHIRGVDVLARRYNLPVYISSKLLTSGYFLDFVYYGKVQIVPFTTERSFKINDAEIIPFSVPHDVVDNVGFRVAAPNEGILAYATDIGHLSNDIFDYCYKADYLVFESNYHESMLINGPYPPSLKSRIMGPNGHLSNYDTREALEKLIHTDMYGIVLIHLSKENNTPEKTLEVMKELQAEVPTHVAPRSEPKIWFSK